MAATRVLVLGVTGMLGHVIYSRLLKSGVLDVRGAARAPRSMVVRSFGQEAMERISCGVEAMHDDSLTRTLASVKPDVVVNCVGLIKQSLQAADPMLAISLNSLLPQRLLLHCRASGARLIHISTDCVFSGSKGNYKEDDFSDAGDLYGRTKYLGETSGQGGVTLRTSIIGHELGTTSGLLEWFLSQQGEVLGYTKAVFSGFPTVELADVIQEHIIPNSSLCGVYNVASEPISKYDLIGLMAKEYGNQVDIKPDDKVREDRSLDGARFTEKTGYKPPDWAELVRKMRNHYLAEDIYMYKRSEDKR